MPAQYMPAPMLLIAVVSILTLSRAQRPVTRHGATAYLNALAARAYVDSRMRAYNSPSQFVTPLNLTSQRIVNVADPEEAQDAATKRYADASASGGVLRTQIYTNAANGNAVNFNFPEGKSIKNGTIAIVGLWVGQSNFRFYRPPDNVVWIDAYSYRGFISTLRLSVDVDNNTLRVGSFLNSTGDVLIHYLEYP